MMLERMSLVGATSKVDRKRSGLSEQGTIVGRIDPKLEYGYQCHRTKCPHPCTFQNCPI
jgi:hypothetical protein